ncbi:MAG TPA: hypothetical protein DCE47_04100 [Planctomycetaceae bacterium]|nr:hypothetical protein [Planctomycetaceae bacterium]HCD01463.1 hypothetical protein [Planctomycetaceae bacterium]|tara:strand:+ start:1458 stop:2003 length:546 start_codon:yes stop_codon:yes gene_type:complete
MKAHATHLPTVLLISSLVGCGSQPAPTVDIWTATATGNYKVVEQYLASGTDANLKSPQTGGSLLGFAVAKGELEIVKLLIGSGTDVEITDGGGGTSLHTAVFMGYSDIADFLIKQGADVHATDNSGVAVADMLLIDFDASEEILQPVNQALSESLQITLEPISLASGRERCRELLKQHGVN